MPKYVRHMFRSEVLKFSVLIELSSILKQCVLRIWRLVGNSSGSCSEDGGSGIGDGRGTSWDVPLLTDGQGRAQKSWAPHRT